ncbi:hypothetical protein HPO96_19780 [Kribbella sandramycini]|uniref:Uncharacterized protein n=1 Tax=Kribbella sandramycini TaxID=60450 RepID=A0A7Y4L1A0_9ACTN|nr:hypothetical protein [Kribbella sandramycini]MBB6564791.1 hypothetical protein [Kribbella sandramycini]NOL42490.1 hypothetical protein [Kribbella sandramycini]
MVRRLVVALTGLSLVLTACAAPIAPADAAIGTDRSAGTTSVVQPASAVATRSAKITGIKTSNATTGVITVNGSIVPAPAEGTRIRLHQLNPATKKWQEIGYGLSKGTTVVVTVKQPASVRDYRLAVYAQAPYPAATSSVVTFHHYVWRGLFKRGVLASGGKGNPQLTVIPPNEGPRRSEADFLADKGGFVWGEIDSTGCSHFKSWLGNLTDGDARASLHNGPRAKAIASVRMKMETEKPDFTAKILGITKLRMQVTDVASGYGPYISVDSYLLCTN